MVIPIQWYEPVQGQTGVYYLSKNKHLLNLHHILFCPNSIELVPTKKTKPNFSAKADDHDMLQSVTSHKNNHNFGETHLFLVLLRFELIIFLFLTLKPSFLVQIGHFRPEKG